MQTSRLPRAGAALSLAAFLCLSVASALAQQVPLDVGTIVPGYQDDFDGAALSPNWTVRGAGVYSVSGGLLHVATVHVWRET